MGAELEALLGEPLDGSGDRRAARRQPLSGRRFTRRLPAMTHRLVAALAEVPIAELGEPTLAAALATLLRISKDEAHRRIERGAAIWGRARR